MKYFPPDAEELELNTIILDLNGTLAVNRKIPSGVEERIKALKALSFTIVLFTFDFQSEAALQAAEMGIELVKTNNQAEKTAAAQKYKPENTVAIGNARIDIGTFTNAKLRIATLQAEGIHTAIIPFVDIIVPSINDALDLLLDQKIFNATMRI